jgi:hypothetical protein
MDSDDASRIRERFWLRILAIGCALFWLGVALEWYLEKPLLHLIWEPSG